jgi:hypothetical protein
MQSQDWEKHYSAFKWAVSRDWKDKNGLHRSIQYKIETLVQECNLSEKEIVDELFFNYWERAHFQRFDVAKGSLNNWIAHYVDLYLNHLLRRCAIRSKEDPCDYFKKLNCYIFFKFFWTTLFKAIGWKRMEECGSDWRVSQVSLMTISG